MTLRSETRIRYQVQKVKRGFFIRCSLLVSVIASMLGPVTGASAQTPTPPPQVRALLSAMTPEERVGQLFLVSFLGTDASETSQVYDLIANYHIGGVILRGENDNFVSEPGTISSLHQLVTDLQNIEWASSQQGDVLPRKSYVPLFIGVSQEGGGAPYDQILSGMTPLPNQMAIGATWKNESAAQVGSVLGGELSAIGINLLLGPSLDVVELPDPAARSDLETRVFGGDSFWTGKLGQAYISGVHDGSNNRIFVVAKHFPGAGGSDRAPEEEVATVRKSLEQLKQVELSPFFAVTTASDAQANADGLLVSHIRYQGFQGNIRATTRPVSFDASALSAILSLPQFSAWRDNGGLMVSDDLGSQAVREFYSLGGEKFSPRLVARDAFLAGNDLLYLGNIRADDGDDTYNATLRIVEAFAQEYRNDAVFAQAVDAAVLRILSHKFRMYPSLHIDTVKTPSVALRGVGVAGQVSFDIARNAATLISPDPQELNTLLPAPPSANEQIVFLTDVSRYQQCSTCDSYDGLAVDALQKNVLRLFGPEGSGQVVRTRVNSFSFDELQAMLDNVSETNIESSLITASWVVISLADVGDGQITLLRRFFSEKPNLIRNKNVVLFSFTAPYYLDATDISKLTAYYALYSKQPAFVDTAARILFQQISLAGSSPVSIPAVGYDLIKQTSPDPDQIIPLQVSQPETQPTVEATPSTPEVPSVPSYKIGDSISVRAGPILDHNHHLVPDSTVVRFTLATRDETGSILQQVDVTTTDGIARTSFVIDKPGKVEIRVISEPALLSEVLQFDATDTGVAVTVVAPVLTEEVETAVPTITPSPENGFISPGGYPRTGMWMVILFAALSSAFLAYWAVSRVLNVRWGVRFALCVLVGAFAAYNYLALGFPGAAAWISSETGGAFGVLLFTLAGEAAGAISAWVWWRWFSGSVSQTG